MALALRLFFALTLLWIVVDFCECQTFPNRYARLQCGHMRMENIAGMFRYKINGVYERIGYPNWTQVEKKFISCKRRGLTEVPQYLETDVQVLDLSHNMITHIRKNAFGRYQHLEAINLESNCVEYDALYTVPKCTGSVVHDRDVFRSLKRLKFINLSTNSGSIQNFPIGLPESLLVFFASFSLLSPIPRDELRKLKDLEVVVVSSNCIMEDPASFCRGRFTIEGEQFASTKLQYLDIAYNNWTSVPRNLLTASLKALRMQANPVRRIGLNDFEKSPNLRYLIISFVSQYNYRPLEIVGDPFANLTELIYLDLSGNMLTTVPKGFLVKNRKMENLILQLNCFKSLATDPTMLPPLPNLKFLDMTGNTLCRKSRHPVKPQKDLLKLGDSLRGFPKLEGFSLGPRRNVHKVGKYLSYGTEYATVNASSFAVLEALPRFAYLNIAFCGIKTVNTTAWRKLHRVVSVDARINHIGESGYMPHHGKRLGKFSPKPAKYVPSEVDEITTSLGAIAKSYDILNLRQNAISDIRTINFTDCAFVKYLDLSYNRINFIYSDTFRPMPKLYQVDLSQNPIRYIGDTAFLGLRHFSSLHLDVNVYENDLQLEFLGSILRPVDLLLDGLKGNIYELLKSYRGSSQRFDKVSHLKVHIRIPVDALPSTNGLFSIFPNLNNLSMTYAWLHFALSGKFFQGIPHLKQLDISNNGIQIFPIEELLQLPQLKSLILSHNHLTTVPGKGLERMSKLIYLNLAHNRLKDIYHLHKLPALLRLNIFDNQVTDIGPKALNKTFLSRLTFLDLRFNKFVCKCSLTTTFGWIVNTPLMKNLKIFSFLPYCSDEMINYYGGCVVCQSGQSYISLLTYSTSHACELNFALHMLAASTTSVVLFLSLALLLNSKQLRNFLVRHVNKKIRLSSFTERDEGFEEVGGGIKYNGFIYHDHEDQKIGDWVQDHLVPELESGNPSFNICVSGRDEFCGMTQVVQAVIKMAMSKKTVVVLSTESTTSPRIKYILSVLENWFYVSGVDRCVLIALGRVLPNSLLCFPYFSTHQHEVLKVPDNSDDLVAFWEALKTSMIVTRRIEV